MPFPISCTPWVNAQFAILNSTRPYPASLPDGRRRAIPICGNYRFKARRERMANNQVSKRGKGRPGDNSVGREALLATAKRLIEVLPPSRVTISLIAREAGVDPALVRYYFGDRSNLLFAVAESMLDDSRRSAAVTLE